MTHAFSGTFPRDQSHQKSCQHLRKLQVWSPRRSRTARVLDVRCQEVPRHVQPRGDHRLEESQRRAEVLTTQRLLRRLGPGASWQSGRLRSQRNLCWYQLAFVTSASTAANSGSSIVLFHTARPVWYQNENL